MKKTLASISIVMACATSMSVLADSAQVQTRVLNGQDASKLSEELLLPWQAAWLSAPQSQNNNLVTSWCGAVVIDDHWLVTAAHCVIPEMSDQIVVGTPVIRNKQGDADNIDDKYLFRINIEESVVHPNYDAGSEYELRADNDIALIKVDRSMSDVAKPIRIATPQEQKGINLEFEQTWNPTGYSEANLIASGWGYHEPDFDQPNNLMVVKLGGIPMDKCNTSYKLGENSHFVCADSNTPEIKKDVCKGDSGGPLVWQNPTHANDPDFGLRVIGVVSNGPLCRLKENGHPNAQTNGLYTELSSYYNWIEAKTGLTLNEVQTSTFNVDPFEKVKEDKPDGKEGNGGTNQTGNGGTKGSSGGGSLPLSGLISLSALALLRRKTY